MLKYKELTYPPEIGETRNVFIKEHNYYSICNLKYYKCLTDINIIPLKLLYPYIKLFFNKDGDDSICDHIGD